VTWSEHITDTSSLHSTSSTEAVKTCACWKTVTQLLFLNSKIICTFFQQNLDQNYKHCLKQWYKVNTMSDVWEKHLWFSFRAVYYNWGLGYERKRALTHVKITDPKYSVWWLKQHSRDLKESSMIRVMFSKRSVYCTQAADFSTIIYPLDIWHSITCIMWDGVCVWCEMMCVW